MLRRAFLDIRDFQQYYDLVGYVQTGDVPGRKEPGTGGFLRCAKAYREADGFEVA